MREILASGIIELKIQLRYPLNMLFNVVASLFTLIPLIVITTLFNYSNYTWIISGGLIWMFISQAIWTIGLSLRSEQHRGTLEQVLLSPSRLSRIIVGKSLITVVLNFVTALIGLSVIKLFISPQLGIGLCVLVILISIPAIYGLAFIVSVIVLKMKEVFALLQVATALLMVLSGVCQPISMLSPTLAQASKFIVFEQIVSLFRSCADGTAAIGTVVLPVSLILLEGVIILAIGLVMLERFQRKTLLNGEALNV